MGASLQKYGIHVLNFYVWYLNASTLWATTYPNMVLNFYVLNSHFVLDFSLFVFALCSKLLYMVSKTHYVVFFSRAAVVLNFYVWYLNRFALNELDFAVLVF